MMQSMTGFGRGKAQHGEVFIEVEFKALNARQSDIRLKLPSIYRGLEHKLRGRAQTKANRGKIEILVERKDAAGGDLSQGINEALFNRYYKQLQQLAPVPDTAKATMTAAILRLPNVVGNMDAVLDNAEVAALEKAFDAALTDFLSFRSTEGQSLSTDLAAHVNAIAKAIPEVEAFEQARQEKMRARLERIISDNLNKNAVDQNRLEQEVIYYLEKIDISEEKVRLAQHCEFFMEKLMDADIEKGRRLAFITQEMGREINTLGAKAYSSDIQRLVVQMKEDLEKVKEQLANVV